MDSMDRSSVPGLPSFIAASVESYVEAIKAREGRKKAFDAAPLNNRVVCPECLGKHRSYQHKNHGKVCPVCGGSGGILDYK